MSNRLMQNGLSPPAKQLFKLHPQEHNKKEDFPMLKNSLGKMEKYD